MEKSTGTLQIISIAVIGAVCLLVSVLWGNRDLDAIMNDLPYDIGIACLIIASVEMGAMRQIARIDRMMDERGERKEQQDISDLKDKLLNVNFREQFRKELQTNSMIPAEERAALREILREADEFAKKGKDWRQQRRHRWPD